jgi:PAS domain S-box-containing protein
LPENSLSQLRKRLTGSLKPHHVVAAGVAIFASIVIGSVIAAFLLRHDALHAARVEISNMSTLLAEHAVGTVESADRALTDMADELGQNSSAPAIKPSLALHEYLKKHLHSNRAVRSLSIHDSQGNLAASTLGFPATPLHSGDQESSTFHQKTPGTAAFIDQPARERGSGQWIIGQSKRMSGLQGEFLGVLTAGLSVEYFQSFYASLRLDKASTVLLLHVDGTIMAAFPPDESLLGKAAAPALLEHVDDAGLMNLQLTNDPAGKSQYALVNVKRLENYPLMVAVAMSEAQVYGPWRYQSRFLLGGALGTGALALVLMLLFARHLRREISLDQSLHQTEEIYHALTDQRLAGVATLSAPHGNYLAVNQRFCEMTGYSEEELLGQTLPAMMTADDPAHIKPRLVQQMAAADHDAQTLQLRLTRKDGNVLHAVASMQKLKNSGPTAGQLIALFQDVTAAEEQKWRFQEEEIRLSMIIHNSMDAIITIDGNEKIQIFNAAAEQMFGYSAAQALNMTLSALIPGRYRDRHHAHVQNFSHSGESSRKMGHHMVLRGLRASGEEFPLEASISRASTEGKVYMTVILRDLTARVQAQSELDRARAQLRELSIASQTAREEEKARISRELHDELGQNLTALKMDLSWLESHASNDVAGRAARIAAMQGVLDSTVVATRRIAADLRPLMLDDLGLMAALEWLTQDFSRRTAVICDLAIDDAVVEVDQRVQSALYRAVQECLTNVARHAHATRVKIDLKVLESAVHLSVTDDGRGISQADQARRGSFGLIGMRERVYILGGSVDISSKTGAGTHISIVMPREPNTDEKLAAR